MDTALDIEKEEKQATQLPEPTGYRILIAIPEKEEKTEGGILKADETIRNEEVATITGFVLKFCLQKLCIVLKFLRSSSLISVNLLAALCLASFTALLVKDKYAI
jgi:hypothetical protein